MFYTNNKTSTITFFSLIEEYQEETTKDASTSANCLCPFALPNRRGVIFCKQQTIPGIIFSKLTLKTYFFFQQLTNNRVLKHLNIANNR